jgi:hypothetical protein
MWLPARMSHDHVRPGTTSLFATPEVASGKVHGVATGASDTPGSAASWSRWRGAIPSWSCCI